MARKRSEYRRGVKVKASQKIVAIQYWDGQYLTLKFSRKIDYVWSKNGEKSVRKRLIFSHGMVIPWRWKPVKIWLVNERSESWLLFDGNMLTVIWRCSNDGFLTSKIFGKKSYIFNLFITVAQRWGPTSYWRFFDHLVRIALPTIFWYD